MCKCVNVLFIISVGEHPSYVDGSVNIYIYFKYHALSHLIQCVFVSVWLSVYFGVSSGLCSSWKGFNAAQASREPSSFASS